MRYYKGYLDKEWVRAQTRKLGLEIRGLELTEFCEKIEYEIGMEMPHLKMEDIIKQVVENASQKRI